MAMVKKGTLIVYQENRSPITRDCYRDSADPRQDPVDVEILPVVAPLTPGQLPVAGTTGVTGIPIGSIKYRDVAGKLHTWSFSPSVVFEIVEA
jgi:hypothetical protein